MGKAIPKIETSGDTDSWFPIPERQFDLREPPQTSLVGFEFVLAALRAERAQARRKDWEVGRLIYLVDGSTFEVNRAPLNTIFPEGTKIDYRPHIDERRGNVCGVWSPEQEDLLAEDWVVYYMAE